MSEDEALEYTKEYLEKVRVESYQKTIDDANKLLDNIRIQSRTPTKEDIIELKKWMRLSILFPQRFYRYVPKFKVFHDNYNHMIYNNMELIYKLNKDVWIELQVEPVNDKDFEFVAKGVIETIKKK